METIADKLNKLEKELAELRKDLSSPEVTCGNYYRKDGFYYVTVRLGGDTYALINLASGLKWVLDKGSQADYQKELKSFHFEYVGKYQDFITQLAFHTLKTTAEHTLESK